MTEIDQNLLDTIGGARIMGSTWMDSCIRYVPGKPTMECP